MLLELQYVDDEEDREEKERGLAVVCDPDNLFCEGAYYCWIGHFGVVPLQAVVSVLLYFDLLEGGFVGSAYLRRAEILSSVAKMISATIAGK